jgi:hypothetical protein
MMLLYFFLFIKVKSSFDMVKVNPRATRLNWVNSKLNFSYTWFEPRDKLAEFQINPWKI